VILQILRQAFAGSSRSFKLRVGDVARDDHRAAQREPVLTGYLREQRADLGHRPTEVDLHDLAAERLLVDSGQERAGSRSSCSRNTPSLVILPLAWRSAAARDRDGDRAARAVARQPDHAHVVAEVLAAELRADAEALRQLEHLALELEVAEAVALVAALRRQRRRGTARSRAWPSSARSRPRCRR
jgi:hypothetical protein